MNEILNDKLQKAIQFTKDDLYMNRQGKLTPSQIEKLKQGMFDPNKWNKFIIGLMIGGGILVILRDGLDVLKLEFILAYLGFCVIFYFLYSLYFKSMPKKLEEGRYALEPMEGIVTILADQKSLTSGSMSQYGSAINLGEQLSGINLGENAFVIEIGGKKLYTNKQIQEAFENGKKYAIYVLKMSNQEYKNALVGAVIVSAEPLGGMEDEF